MRTQKCPICKKDFQVSGKAKRRCCSVKCLGEHYKEALKGKNNPNYRHGKKYCADCRKELSRNNKSGYCMRCAKLGKRNHFYGKSHTEATRQKMAEREYKTGPDNHLYGVKHTAEQRSRLSVIRKSWWASASAESKQQIMDSLLKGCKSQLDRKGPTKPEVAVAEWLAARNIPFQFNAFLYDKFYVDFLLGNGVIVEVFGDYWHANPETFSTLNEHQQRQVKKDKSRIAYLTECGCKVIVIWEKEIKSGNFSSLESRLIEL